MIVGPSRRSAIHAFGVYGCGSTGGVGTPTGSSRATARAPPRRGAEGVTVFSPFGLGVLDLAVGRLLRNLAKEQGVGMCVKGFLPE